MASGQIDTRPLVYVAGPYTEGERTLNIQRAVYLMESIIEVGGVPFVPHLTQLADLVSPHSYEYWMHYCMLMVARCDMLVRIPGPSVGSDNEMRAAMSLGIPVYKYSSLDSACDRTAFAVEYTYLGVSLYEAIQMWDRSAVADGHRAAAEANADEWRAIALRAMRGIGEMKGVVHKLNEELNIDPEEEEEG
jgi:hypothetical protein